MYLARELWFSGWVVARRGAALATALVAGALVIHALNGGSLTHPLLWANDFDTKAILRDLVAQYADSDPKPAQVAVSGVWFFEPTVNFYRVTWKLYWMREYRREQPIGRADYYLLPPQDYLAMRQVRPMSVVRQYELSQIVLAKEGPG